MIRAVVVRVALLLTFVAACVLAFANPKSPSIERRVDELMSKMTLEEKIGQLNQINNGPATGPVFPGKAGKSIEQAIAAGEIGSILNATGAAETNQLQRIAVEKSRLHIPILFGFDVIHGYRTVFPIPLGLAASWDPAAAKRASQIAATEASASGIRWTFSPMVDVARDPRWGRIAEGAGEDPYLGSAMARAYVSGYQGSDLSDASSIAACAKHYVGYGGAEGGRDYNTVDMSENRLREIYMRPFKAAAEAGAVTFMNSFNSLNGIPATANEFTLRKVLKGEWGFNGFVVSDWNSVGELIPHGVAANEAEAARIAINAGTDMDMTAGDYLDQLPALVKSGKVSQSVLDDAVRRVLRVKFELGLFDHPYTDTAREQREILTTENRQTAREIAQKTIVLLKNDGKLLPLAKSARSLAVIGPLADSKLDMLGNWSAKGRAEDAVSILEGIRAKVGQSAQVTYAKGVEVSGGTESGIEEAVNAAKQADVVILSLGELGAMSGEAHSRASIELPGKQQQLLEAVAQTGKPVVLVLMNGRPLAIPWAAEHVPAIVEAWFPGIEGGNAVADVLFGDVNPSAKLPVTFPRSVGQVPIYYSRLNTGRPAPTAFDVNYSGYIDAPNTPQFVFGHGLSYTKFAYSNLALSDNKIASGGAVKATVDVQNTGDRTGDEIVQLYLRDLVGSASRPVKELKGFRRLTLAPGEKKTVEFTIGREELAFWTAAMKYDVEPGAYKLWIGPNSAEGLEASFEVTQ